MNKKKWSASIAVLLCAGGLFAISAVVVPNLVNSAVVAKDSTAAPQKDVRLPLTESAVPVLKVEAPVPVSTVEDYLRKNMTQEQIQQIDGFLDRGLEPQGDSSRELTESETKRQLVLVCIKRNLAFLPNGGCISLPTRSGPCGDKDRRYGITM
ncbi:hypothetical protein [Paenibacillus sp. FSL R7-0333]|uniref:hypothetical protein n=1 Tax=Paenibacillus sp. FSL R7-0333 TaxID=1926587 RepID=UPI00096C1C79|nr:hypothetical protein BK146_30555 [Paenibacillus sp. FSL R7-0333]